MNYQNVQNKKCKQYFIVIKYESMNTKETEQGFYGKRFYFKKKFEHNKKIIIFLLLFIPF
jgi:hypothetical protein